MRIVLFGDFHYPYFLECADRSTAAARDRAYRTLADHLLAERADYLVGVGDVTNFGYPEEFAGVRELFDPAGERFLYVLGNHDTLLLPKEEIEAEIGQARFRVVEHDEATLIFLDSTRDRSLRDWSGTMDGEQLRWLAGVLGSREEGDDRPFLVFVHHPPYGTTARSTEAKMHVDPAVPLIDLLASAPAPVVVFTGHNHVHSVVYRQGIAFVQTAAVLDSPGYRVIEVGEGRMRVDFRPIADPELRQAIGHFHRRMPGFSPYPAPEGTESDRTAEIPLSAKGKGKGRPPTARELPQSRDV
ncbi:metallophosphoesterase family protein [Brockia lithotrophica]|uniref:3',5'-cyclic AMP phosphodiesterase CpdA n=1 Tax=Brockia lithotrophica TaxID=933949 RepID=A0A660L665_9BACL|nr:metallophosphoesterase [Brockia lithotrophica]RKQ88389.1 3',5'-cyclic AMP phosphodiesterase CpdA [Brockia lithotrophica]